MAVCRATGGLTGSTALRAAVPVSLGVRWPLDTREARQVIGPVLEEYEAKSYEHLFEVVEDSFELSHTDYRSVRGASGVEYQVRTNVFLEDRRTGQLRVRVAVDDGGSRAVAPVTECLLIDKGESSSGMGST